MRWRVGGEPCGASAGAGAQRIDKRQFQIFDLYAVKGWSPTEVAQTLGLSVARVYLTKHPVSAILKKKARALEREHSGDSNA